MQVEGDSNTLQSMGKCKDQTGSHSLKRILGGWSDDQELKNTGCFYISPWFGFQDSHLGSQISYSRASAVLFWLVPSPNTHTAQMYVQ